MTFSLGLYDRKGIPADIQGGVSGYRAVLGGFVINDPSSIDNSGISWVNLQPSAGSPVGSGALGGSAKTAIDNAFVAARSYNSTIGNPAPGVGPPYLWRTKLRLFMGASTTAQSQPAWLLSAYPGDVVTNASGKKMVPWFSTNFYNAYVQFMAVLAAYVPKGETLPLSQNDLLGEIAFGGGVWPEPFLLQAYGWTQAVLGNPSTATMQTGLQNNILATIAAFPSTPVSVALNPPQNGLGSNTWLLGTFVPWLIAAGGMLENNSMGASPAPAGTSGIGVKGPFTGNDPNTGAPWYIYQTLYVDRHGQSYADMYTTMAKAGKGAAATALGSGPAASPVGICIQTDTYAKNGGTPTDLMNTLSYAVAIGARMIELPSGYNNLTPAQLDKYNAGLTANNPTSSGTSGGTPVQQHVTGGTSAAATTLTVQNAITTAGNRLVLAIFARTATGSGVPVISVGNVGGASWTNRVNQNAGGLNGNLTVWGCQPNTPVAANGITITSTVAGSIEYEFYEIPNTGSFEIATVATGNSTAPTVSQAPAAASDIVIGVIGWTSGTVTITSLPGAPWNSPADPTAVGVAASAGSSLQSQWALPNATTSQTYHGTLSASAQWVAAIAIWRTVTTAVPDTPTGVTAVAGDATALVKIGAVPASPGSPITSYIVTPYIFSGGVWTTSGAPAAITGLDPSDPVNSGWLIGGLTNGTAYEFSAKAVSAVGTSAESALSSSVTPSFVPAPAPPPSPPPVVPLVPISDKYKTALQNSHRIAVTVEVWNAGTMLTTFQPEADSTVTVDRRNLIRRSCALSVVDVDGTLVPTTQDSALMPYGNELRVYRGITFDDGTQEMALLGIFGIEDVRINDTGADAVIAITGMDRARAFQRAKLEDTYAIAPNSDLGGAIRALLQSRVTGSTTDFQFVPLAYSTPTSAIVLQTGDDPWQRASEAATAGGMQLYFNRGGSCVLQPIPDPASAPVAWSYDEGPASITTSLNRALSRSVGANVFIRDGMGSGLTVPVRGIAQDDNPLSPTFVGGRYGRVVDYQSSSLYSTQAQAQAAADAAKALGLGVAETLNLSALVKPDHEPGDVVEVTRARAGLSSVYFVLDAFTIGLGPQGSLTVNAARRVNR